MLKKLEDKRVTQWAIGYLAGSLGALQVLDILWDIFQWPVSLLRIAIFVIACGFFVVIAVAWTRPTKNKPAKPKNTIARKRSYLLPGISLVLLLSLMVGVGFTINNSLQRQWARGEAVLEIQALAEQESFRAALQVLERALGLLPDHPDLLTLQNEVSVAPDVDTVPPSASVYVRDYDDNQGDWQYLGETPLADARIARGQKHWRITKEGYANMEVTGGAGGPQRNRPMILMEENLIPAGMVAVPGGRLQSFITGVDPFSNIEIDPFSIDRYEVTNEDYQSFVDADGYSQQEYWNEAFYIDGVELSFEEAMGRFVDATGQPGPAMWEVSHFVEGEAQFPVSGVSWYEAAAYAEFVGKSLPTLHHWVAAAGTNDSAILIPQSHFGEGGPQAVGQSDALSKWGAYDMAGNVREWLWNSSGEQRHNLGGAWDDDTYFFTFANVQSPWDRLPSNGFRLAQYPDGIELDGPLWSEIPVLARDFTEVVPVSDEIFAVYRSQFDYDPTPLDIQIEDEQSFPYLTVQHVSFSGVGWGRIEGVLLIPDDIPPPYQTMVVFNGSGIINAPPVSANGTGAGPPPDFVDWVRSGRAVFMPILRGTFQRRDGLESTWPNESRRYVDYVRSWVSEFKRSIDYLESHGDIDTDKLAYYGVSWGARMGAIIPAVEPRLSTAILVSGGLASGTALPEVDQVNFVTRTTIPTLMINGPFDAIEPVEAAQLPMLRLLGTDPEHKRRIEIEGAGHSLPRIPTVRETLSWLDKYFGPVN